MGRYTFVQYMKQSHCNCNLAEHTFNENMRHFGLHMKFKSFFMTDEEKHSHNFDLPNAKR